MLPIEQDQKPIILSLEQVPFDKSAWGDGPWHDEPDEMCWRDEATDLHCMVMRAEHGAFCGYVAVPEDHPLHGVDFMEARQKIDVHGGLTFSRPGADCRMEPAGLTADQAARLWWFGFDCAHVWDKTPGRDAMMFKLLAGNDLPFIDGIGGMGNPYMIYRELPYVKANVESLARQLRDLARPALTGEAAQ